MRNLPLICMSVILWIRQSFLRASRSFAKTGFQVPISGPLWETLGRSWCALGAFLGLPCVFFGRSGDLFGGSRANLGPLGRPFGRSLAGLSRFLGAPGHFCLFVCLFGGRRALLDNLNVCLFVCMCVYVYLFVCLVGCLVVCLFV